MVRTARFLALALVGVLLLFCAAAVMAVDCEGSLSCAASKFALGYLMIGLLAVFGGTIEWSTRTPVVPLTLTLIPAFPSISPLPQVSPRAPPALF